MHIFYWCAFDTNVFQVLEVPLCSCALLLESAPTSIWDDKSSNSSSYLGSRRPMFWSSSNSWLYTLHLTGTEAVRGIYISPFPMRAVMSRPYLSCASAQWVIEGCALFFFWHKGWRPPPKPQNSPEARSYRYGWYTSCFEGNTSLSVSVK